MSEKEKKKKSLVDAFLFRKAKEAIDKLHSTDHTPDHSPYHTSYQTPYHTPDHSPDHSPSPYHTSNHTPYHTSDHAQKEEKVEKPREIKELKPSSDHTSDQTPYHSPYHTPDHSPYHTSYQTPYHTPDHSPDHSSDHMVYLSRNEALLYYTLLMNVGCFTTVKRLSKKLGRSEHTLRKCLKRLADKGFVKYKVELLRNQRGIRIVHVKETNVAVKDEKVFEDLESLPISEISIDQPHLTTRLTRHLTKHLTTHFTNRLTRHLTIEDISSSSSLNKKTTTTKETDPHLEELFKRPFMTYWKDKGLTPKQVAGWMEECGMSGEEMMQSLEHCWYEMVHLKKEENKEIRDVCSYFYTVIRKNGFYPRPEGFKTVEQLRAEQMEQARKEREKAIEKLKEEIRKDWKLKREEAFYRMLSNPESKEYRACFEMLNPFEKKLERGSPSFERAMRKAFEKLFPEEKAKE